MRRFLYDVLTIAIGTILVTTLVDMWDNKITDNIVYDNTTRTMRSTVPTRVPTFTPLPTTQPLPNEPQTIYLFNLQPTRIWFDKNDALGYREALLNGDPTRPYISLEKSRTVRGGRAYVLKQEDGLIMIKNN